MVFHLLEFNSALKHHNKSNSFQYKLVGSLYRGGEAYNYSTFLFQVNGSIQSGGALY